jgi:hypothetical protein
LVSAVDAAIERYERGETMNEEQMKEMFKGFNPKDEPAGVNEGDPARSAGETGAWRPIATPWEAWAQRGPNGRGAGACGVGGDAR